MAQPFLNPADLQPAPENRTARDTYAAPHSEAAPQSEAAPGWSLRPVARSLVVPAGTRRGTLPSAFPSPLVSASDAFVAALVELGVEHAFGVFGGGIAPFCAALSRSPIRLMHCRSETGAAFAAIESSLASGKLAVVVATTGPGLTSLVTGMAAARSEGAHVLFVSGATSASQRGRNAFQETSQQLGLGALLQPGPLLHHAQVLEHSAEIAPLCSRLVNGVADRTGFVAHVSMPLCVQTSELEPVSVRVSRLEEGAPSSNTSDHCYDLLRSGRFVIWAGFGARHAAQEVRELAERSGAPVMCSPRAKGVMPESHPLYLGVTGLGGHGSVEEYLESTAVDRVLVLGSKLGEMTSFWSPTFAPTDGFVHVDLDPSAFGSAYPEAATLGVQADVGEFLRGLLARWPEQPRAWPQLPARALGVNRTRPGAFVRYSALMREVQHCVVEGSEAIVLTEAGNSFMLGSHYLSFEQPGRYRVSTRFGSMGQASAGVLGAASAHGKAVALAGDGSLLMFNELNTAAKYGIPAVWVVLNDARYGMIEDGMQSIGWTPFETDFPRADFAAIAQGLGVPAVTVTHERELRAAFTTALRAKGPYLIDVWINTDEPAPSNRRNRSLMKQGVNGEPQS